MKDHSTFTFSCSSHTTYACSMHTWVVCNVKVRLPTRCETRIGIDVQLDRLYVQARQIREGVAIDMSGRARQEQTDLPSADRAKQDRASQAEDDAGFDQCIRWQKRVGQSRAWQGREG